jgi:hypothetical protein
MFKPDPMKVPVKFDSTPKGGGGSKISGTGLFSSLPSCGSIWKLEGTLMLGAELLGGEVVVERIV